jgi:hypothetical protein
MISALVAFILVLYFSSLLIGPQIAFLILVGTGIYGLTSVGAGLRALALMAVLRMLNPTLVFLPEGAAALTWGVVLLTSMRILLTLSASDIKTIGPLWAYALVVAALAVVSSANPDISLMKLLSFTLSASAALIGFRRLDDQARAWMLVWLCSLWLVVVLLSIPTLLAPGIGFARNGRGFQGIFNHPQALAIFLVPAVVWFTTQAFGYKHKIAPRAATFAVVLWTIMLATLARTAFAGSVLSLSFSALLGRLRSRADLSVARRRLFIALAAVACVGALMAVASTTVSERIQGFVFKGGVEAYEGMGEAFHASRGKGIEVQWQNFLESPITGHGFQVYPSGEFPGGVKRIWGIPVSASVEKGFMFVAVLEETGIVGAMFLFILLYSLYRSVKATGDLRRLALFFSCLLVNFGEAVFFAAGGLGLYFWILIGFAAAGSTGQASGDGS